MKATKDKANKFSTIKLNVQSKLFCKSIRFLSLLFVTFYGKTGLVVMIVEIPVLKFLIGLTSFYSC